MLIFLLQGLHDRHATSYTRLLGVYQATGAELMARDAELQRFRGTLFSFSGGASAHPLGVAPEVRAGCSAAGPNLFFRLLLFSSFSFFWFSPPR